MRIPNSFKYFNKVVCELDFCLRKRGSLHAKSSVMRPNLLFVKEGKEKKSGNDGAR